MVGWKCVVFELKQLIYKNELVHEIYFEYNQNIDIHYLCLPSSLHDVALNVERCATSFIEKKPFTSAKTIIVPGHSIRNQRHVLICSETR